MKPRKSLLIAGQGHPRSSISVSIEGAYATSTSQSLVSLDVSVTVFEISLKIENGLFFHPSLV